jgi:hypothetical protein
VYVIARGHGMSARSIEAQADARARQDDYIRTVAATDAGRASAAEQITSAKALLDSGTIDTIEFEQLKAEALGTRPTTAR